VCGDSYNPDRFQDQKAGRKKAGGGRECSLDPMENHKTRLAIGEEKKTRPRRGISPDKKGRGGSWKYSTRGH